MRVLQAIVLPLKSGLSRLLALLEQPLYAMRLNREEIAERRRDRDEGAEEAYLWCWQHRGFW